MQKLEIDASRLQKIQMLGKGSFGQVWKGKQDVTTDVAIKTLEIVEVVETGQKNQVIIQKLFEEVKIMKELNHPNIVKCYGYCKNPPQIVLELMNQSLFTYLKNEQNFIPWEQRVQISIDIVSGLKSIHDNKILHRDLKSPNVLLDGNFKAKITDFGLSRVKLETKQLQIYSQVGTFRWMAPELTSEQPVYNYQSDIYALGVTFWEIAARKIPFEQANDAGIIRLLLEKKREQIPEDCPPQFKDIIQGC